MRYMLEKMLLWSGQSLSKKEVSHNVAMRIIFVEILMHELEGCSGWAP